MAQRIGARRHSNNGPSSKSSAGWSLKNCSRFTTSGTYGARARSESSANRGKKARIAGFGHRQTQQHHLTRGHLAHGPVVVPRGKKFRRRGLSQLHLLRWIRIDEGRRSLLTTGSPCAPSSVERALHRAWLLLDAIVIDEIPKHFGEYAKRQQLPRDDRRRGLEMRPVVLVDALRKHADRPRVDRLGARFVGVGEFVYAVSLPNVVTQGEPEREIVYFVDNPY